MTTVADLTNILVLVGLITDFTNAVVIKSSHVVDLIEGLKGMITGPANTENHYY